MTRPDCGAARFLHARGPATVPMRACCAAALIHAAAGADSTAPFVCAVVRHDPPHRVAPSAMPGAGPRA